VFGRSKPKPLDPRAALHAALDRLDGVIDLALGVSPACGSPAKEGLERQMGGGVPSHGRARAHTPVKCHFRWHFAGISFDVPNNFVGTLLALRSSHFSEVKNERFTASRDTEKPFRSHQSTAG
jgi:hypothetical protein